MDFACLCHEICCVFVATSPSTLLLLSSATIFLWFLWKGNKTNLFCAHFTIKIYLHSVSFRVLAKLISRATIYTVKHLHFTSHSGVISIGVRQSEAWVPWLPCETKAGKVMTVLELHSYLSDELSLWLGDQQCFFPYFTAHKNISQEILLQPARSLENIVFLEIQVFRSLSLSYTSCVLLRSPVCTACRKD